LIVLVTLGVAAVFVRQQARTIRRLASESDIPAADRVYYRRQVWRRLIGCVLLVAVAAMMTFWYVYRLDARIDELGDTLKAQRAAGDHRLTQEQDDARRFYVYYVSTMLLLLMAVVILAGVEMAAIRRYAARNLRQIRDDRREMLRRELTALREERSRGGGDPSTN
jgi:hypothetical protein